MFDCSIVILELPAPSGYGTTGPDRLTEEEAARLAVRFFIFEHDHKANLPSPCVYWVRRTDFSV